MAHVAIEHWDAHISIDTVPEIILVEFKKGTNMAEVIKDDVVVSLSATEKAALLELLDAQESLDPRLADLNNSLQTV